ncbi:MAG: helix-turn-helix domain-containing protein [Clostridiales Family XIII bacterium]|jgi:transcriptional regulator with XRE-family HTH domain|nr:helix-turn-helix domain-containing protein [Clostridiales Family XIII bacterium]
MYKIKAQDGTNNRCGKMIMQLRLNQEPPLSQRKLATKLQTLGYDVDHHFIRRIENGERFVTDIELQIFAEFFNVSADDLLGKSGSRPEIIMNPRS